MVARSQEVRLFCEAGLEVVCAQDNLPGAEADPDYHNEQSDYYPPWRDSVSLPTNVCEQIRRFNPYETLGIPDHATQTLVNQYIDMIYVGGNPSVVEGLGTWFTGCIFFRVMGYPNFVAQQATFRRLNDIIGNPAFKSKFIMAPGAEGLISNRYGWITKNRACINAWVDVERMPYQWKEAASERLATTGISYIHFHSYFQQQYREICKSITGFPIQFLGKTNTSELVIRDDRILGSTSFDTLYSNIAKSRVFIDAGDYRNHVIWPPIEATFMGVPVLFVRSSGLVDYLRAAGYDFQSLYEVGMFNTFDELNAWLAENGDDIALLAGIARRQKVMFADHTFGRQTAMKAVKKHIIEKPWNFTNPARMDVSKEEKKSRLQAQNSKDAIVSQELTPLMLDAGESRWFMPQQMRTLKGRVERRNKGRPTLVLNPKTDQAGQVIETFLPPVKAGWYLATLMVEVYEGHDGPVLEAELGRWDGASFVAERANLHQAVPGLAELEFELAVRPGAEDVSRELRVLWSGKGSLGIIGLRLDAAPYPDWLGTEHRP